jgi:hypothetical protein
MPGDDARQISLQQHLKALARIAGDTIRQGASGDMSDRPEGTVAVAGEAVQRKINQAGEAHDKIETFIRDNPMIAVGIGDFLGKIA